MMAILQRFWRLIRANLNFFPQYTEDTEQILDDTLLKMERELISIRSAIAGAIASEKRTERHYVGYQQQAQGWYHRVQLALNQNNEDLAQSALSRCVHDLEMAQNLQKQINQQQEVIQKLKDDLSQAELKQEQLKRKRELLLTKMKTAVTLQEIESLKIELKEGNSAQALTKMEDQVWKLEVNRQLLPQQPLDQLELKFRELEGENQARLLNNQQKLSFPVVNSEIKKNIKAKLRQIRSELENLD